MSDSVKLRLYLPGGGVAETTCALDSGEDEEDIAQQLVEKLTGLDRPSWVQIENLVVFSGAVSAIEVG